MAKVGIIKPSSSTPHARLGTKRPVVNCNYCSCMRLTELQSNIVGQITRMMKPDLMQGS
jgi:hypothetical protein